MDPDGLVCCYPGCIGGINKTSHYVFYTSGFSVRKNNPSSALPLHYFTDVTLVQIFSCNRDIVL